MSVCRQRSTGSKAKFGGAGGDRGPGKQTYNGIERLTRQDNAMTPLLPPAAERKLGDAVIMQVRSMLDSHKTGVSFDCGTIPSEAAGRATLEKMLRRLEGAAGLALPLGANVVRRDEANAIALPGGPVYVFRGLLAKAETADEVAGVIAHEIGHVAHRDGTRAILQGAGLSFLFGMLLGDFVGGGAVVLAAKTMLQSSYSREAEAEADAYGADLMNKAGGDARALATMLDRIGAAINKLAMARPSSPFLDVGEWAALKTICAGS